LFQFLENESRHTSIEYRIFFLCPLSCTTNQSFIKFKNCKTKSHNDKLQLIFKDVSFVFVIKDDFAIGESLGVGGFGDVSLAHLRDYPGKTIIFIES